VGNKYADHVSSECLNKGGKRMLHLVMPMGGKGSRFLQHGYNYPKPLIQIHGAPFFFWAAQSIRKFVKLQSLIFVVLQEHIDSFQIDQEILRYYPEAKIHVITEVLNGAVLTCLEGIKEIEDGPILFNDCDHVFSCTEFYDFCAKEEFDCIDGGLLTFRSDDPQYGYLEFGPDGNVMRTLEKEAISSDAICGAYYFRNAHTFKDAAEEYLSTCNYQEYFVSGVYNIMAAKGQRIKGFRTDLHIPFGTPEEYKSAMTSERFVDFK
jgi:NDP-sugar pyrophosphorylase family protein